FRHIAGVSEIMKTGITSVDQRSAGRFAISRPENAIPDDQLSLPGAAVIRAEVDKASGENGAVLHGKDAAADGIDAHMPEGRITDSCIGYPLMGIKARQHTPVIEKILAEVRA